MKARYLTMLVSAVVTVAMTMSLLFVARRIVLNHFSTLENEHVMDDIQRAVRHLDSELQNLDRTAKDYSSWDDTYDFMQTRRPAYIRSNYTDVSISNLRLRTVILLDTQGNIVYIGAWHRDGKHVELTPDVERVKNAATLLSFRRRGQGMTGIIGLSDGPVLASMRAILTTQEKGPSRGTLIMLRDLDYRLLARIASLAQFPMGVYRTDSVGASVQNGIENGIHYSGRSSIKTINNDQMAITTDLNDWFGHPSFQLEITHNREVWLQGQHAYRFLMYSILIFGCVFGGLALLMVHTVYVRRVETLARFTRRIKTEDDLRSRIHLKWKDELADLADHINRMLEDLQSSHEKLALARERLQHEATHDSLTGTWNCAAALELLDRELARSERENTKVAVLMLDLDHFKTVNDRFGHAAGDRALQAITASVARILRTTDILARYGGEEFLIIAPNCSLAEARRLADRILLRAQATPLELGEHKAIVTTSIGVVSGGYPLSAEELIALADRALYRAKENGRNRAECEEPVPSRVKGTLYCMPRRSV